MFQIASVRRYESGTSDKVALSGEPEDDIVLVRARSCSLSINEDIVMRAMLIEAISVGTLAITEEIHIHAQYHARYKAYRSI